MPTRNLHDHPFDEETILKLEIFEDYLKEWLPTFVMSHADDDIWIFDFFAGTSRRAPRWWQEHSLEWLYRLCMEPGRMWRRYVLGNPLFLYHVIREKLTGNP